MYKLATFQAQTQKATRQTVDGKEYLVAPVVGVVTPIVMNGALLTTDVLVASAGRWEGIDVPVLHPQNASGEHISVNEPSARHQVTGKFKNTSVSVNGESGELKGEVWIDITDAAAKSFDYVVNQLEAADLSAPVMDVSTAFLYSAKKEKGVLNGRAYNHRYTAITPDHLALLPDRPGACTTQDGCGIRANEQGLMSKVRAFFGLAGNDANELADAFFRANAEKSFGQIGDSVRAALKAVYTDPAVFVWIRDLYTDSVVYSVEMPNQPDKLFRRAYSIAESGAVTLDPTAKPVKEVTTYEEITQEVISVNKDCKCGVAANQEPKGETLTAEKVAEIAANAAKEAAKQAVTEVLSANQKETEKAEREELIGKIVAANSKVAKEDLEATPLPVLRTMVNPAVDFSANGGAAPKAKESTYTGKMPVLFPKGGK